jgi:hypothetical protein
MLGPARIRDVPAEIEELPRIDFVLSMLQQYTLARDAIRPAATLVLTVLRCCTVSHNHYDHLDSNSIKRIAQVSPDATWYVPSGLRVCHQRVRTSHLVSGHHRLIDRERERESVCVCVCKTDCTCATATIGIAFGTQCCRAFMVGGAQARLDRHTRCVPSIAALESTYVMHAMHR